MPQTPKESTGVLGEASRASKATGSSPDSPNVAADPEPKGRLRGIIRRFHNEVGSPLAATAIRLEILRNGKRLDPAADALISEISRDLGEVIESVRRSLKELREIEGSPRQQ